MSEPSWAVGPSVMRMVAPAKVNLGLAVTGRRDDGFHTLRSVFLRVSLSDELIAAVGEDGALRDSLSVEGDADCPTEGNLVLRACDLVRRHAGVPTPHLRFHLRKRIPVGAGMAGGSSDAAAALRACLHAWGIRIHPTERLALALRAGADVPFFATGHGAALVRGIGEGLEPLTSPDPPCGLLLVTPQVRLTTRDVFTELDAAAEAVSDAAARVDHLADRLRAGIDGPGLARMAADLRDANDLWAPAARLAPGLATVRGRIEDVANVPFLLTGSGSTLVGVYPSPAAAAEALERLRSEPTGILHGVTAHAASSSRGEERS